MTNRLKLYILFFVLSCTFASAQISIDSLFVSKYERTSMSVCFLHFPSILDDSVFKNNFLDYKLDNKFNKHDIGKSAIVSAPFARQYILNDRYKLIQQKLVELEIPKKMIEKWFYVNDSLSMKLISERGIYNAIESEIKTAEKSKIGILTLKDAGERLIEKSYVLVIDFYNLSESNTYFDKNSVIGYLYKLDWDQQKSDQFYDSAWKSTQYFKNLKVGLKYVNQFYLMNRKGLIANATQSDENFINKTINNVLTEAAKTVPDLRVRTNLVSVKPLRALVGKKEGVLIDQKFLAFERRLNKKGKVVYKYKGSLRAGNYIADNTDSVSGQKKASLLYQDAGKKLYPGMLLEQRYETGLSFSVGWAKRSLQGVILRLEYNISREFKWPLFKFFAEFQVASDNVRFGNGTKNYQLNSTNIAVGLSKEFVLFKNIHLEPFVSVVSDNTKYQVNKAEKYYITTNLETGTSNNLQFEYGQFGLFAGIRLPINLTHNIQIVPSLYYSTIKYPSSGLFGKNLPSNLAKSVKEEMKIDDSQADWNVNNSANIGSDLIKWEALVRIKF